MRFDADVLLGKSMEFDDSSMESFLGMWDIYLVTTNLLSFFERKPQNPVRPPAKTSHKRLRPDCDSFPNDSAQYPGSRAAVTIVRLVT